MTRVAGICEKSHELDTCRSDQLSGCNAHRGLRERRAARQCEQHPAEYRAGAAGGSGFWMGRGFFLDTIGDCMERARDSRWC